MIMVTFLRRFLLLIIGIGLLVAPTAVRNEIWQYDARSYTPPAVPTLALAATPLPTAIPVPLVETVAMRTSELRDGPVVLDLAHYNSINPSSLQPLADALADQGLGLRYWLSKIDALSVTAYLEYPDQSEALAAELADASALIIISPFFLWSPQEIALVEQFVADGGRLLLISDPDISGDYAAATNMIGEPFGVVFNEDYLYDTTRNDGNFTFFFQDAAAAAPVPTTTLPSLADSTIAFYGGRSLSGDLQAVLQSVETTLSSLRLGRNLFTTAAIAGVPERGTAGRVLAMSDLDVLTEPYRQRHDNQRLVDYVADFLSADERVNRVADFPNYLSKEVTLAFGASAAINAELIMQGAQIQQALETSGRTLALSDSTRLTDTVGSTTATGDLIYLADYTTAISQTTLLRDLAIELYREVVTETVPVAPPPPVAASPTSAPADTEETDEAEPEADADERSEVDPTDSPLDPEEPLPLPTLTPAPTLTTTVPFTATGALTGTNAAGSEQERPRAQVPPTATPTPVAVTATITATVSPLASPTVTTTDTMTVTATPTPTLAVRTVITTYLRLASGLTFLAEETVLVVRTAQEDGTTVLAVLAANNRGIDTGVDRLLENDFSGCVIGDSLTFCALEGAGGSTSSSSSPAETTSSAPESEAPSEGSADGDDSDEGDQGPPRGADAPVLLIDDNSAATPSELSEADIYLQALIAGGYQVDLWSVSDQGDPTVDDLLTYGWVIWSNGGYAAGAIDGGDLETLFSYINLNGRITVSSRVPLPGLEESAPLSDLIAENTIPPLVDGLPGTPIALTGDDTTAAVLNALAQGDDATQIVLRRGPASEASEAPALVVLADPADGESEARLMIAAFAMAWLPATEQTTLINNMASWMLNP
jgi:hypothetical protein